ncbi:predicted protein [Naegleria gruberi]|uniref:Predicted protein n=1 Tax=Naegleria gruberi TaxID=5762 RepID=D2UYS1_NAEGR|nr:uncharacterized protein NAEGRDRAFT_61568 [Naegleria gruberi]EFC50837.1 predicted protein [Naegleria gruberi]|eukprot:XP_002683581.1 predicted protein [Naegleria gruberi strain NEG-M]
MWKVRNNAPLNTNKVSIRTPLSGGQNAEQKQLALLSKQIPRGNNVVGRGGGIQFRGESSSDSDEEITYKPTKFSKIYGKQQQDSQSFYEDSQNEDNANKTGIDVSPEESNAVLSAVFDKKKSSSSSMRESQDDEVNMSLPIGKKKQPTPKKNSKVVEDEVISDDDFDKYFDEPSVSLSLNKSSNKSNKKKKGSTSPKKRKITKKSIPEKISGIYYSSSDEDNDMNYDEESQTKSTTSSQMSQPLNKGIIPSLEKTIVPPSFSYNSSASTRKSSSHYYSSTPHKTPTQKRKSQNNSISYHIPKEIEKDDDIDDFSDEETNPTIPVPTMAVLSGVNAALFASAPQATLNNSALISTYLTQQKQVMNNRTSSKPTIDIDDLIVTDSEEEDTTTMNNRDKQFSQMVSAINYSTPQQIQKSAPPPQQPKQISPPKNNNIVISGEDGFDLETRLKGIKKKVGNPRESEVENLLFSNRKSKVVADEDIEDDVMTENNTVNDNNVVGESWLDKLRKSKAPPVAERTVSLSQQSSSGNSTDQFFSQWEHLKKILTVKSSGRFVSKLIRAVNGCLNEKVFANIGSGMTLSQPNSPKDSMVLKILVFSSSPQIYPNLSLCICKMLKRPTQPHDNEILQKNLEENDFFDVFLLREMRDKWNLEPGSIIEIATNLFHITPSSDPHDSNSDWIFRPRPVISYVFEMKCNSQSSDVNELKQDIEQLESKFTFPMLSKDSNEDNMDLTGDDNATPSTPPRTSQGIRSTPTHVRHKNIINTPRRRIDFSSQSEQDYERNYHLISRISNGPFTKKFEIIYKQLHSAFFPSYYVNIQGVIQRVWSYDYIRQTLESSFNEIYNRIPQLANESNMSNSVLIQCSKSRSLCVILLPSGSHEYDYWKSIFDPNISQGKIFQFDVCSFKDRIYIGPNDELYSIVSPMYHTEHNLTTDSQLSNYSNSSEFTNPLIPVYFFTTNKQHTSCKFIPPEDNFSMGSVIGVDPIPENIAPHSSYKHSLYYNFDQPISGDTQQSHGGVEDVVNDENSSRVHRCDIEGKIIYIAENNHDNTTKFSVYVLQKHSNIILRLDSLLLETSMLLAVAYGFSSNRTNVTIHNILVKRTEDMHESTQLIADKFSMIYPSTSSGLEQASDVKFPYSVRLRVEEGFLKKNGRKIQSQSILNSINYEFTCFEKSVGNVEGYISDILEIGDRPTVPVCPHCQKQLTSDSTWFVDTDQICGHCNHKFTKPDHDLLFQVKVGKHVTLTLDTRAIQQIFAYKKGATTNKKLPVTGSETFKQARELVLGHHLKFLCYCEKVNHDESSINYKFKIIHN